VRGADLSYKVIGDVASKVTATTDVDSNPSIYGRRIVYERRRDSVSLITWMAWAKPGDHPPPQVPTGTPRPVVVSREYFSAAETDVAVVAPERTSRTRFRLPPSRECLEGHCCDETDLVPPRCSPRSAA